MASGAAEKTWGRMLGKAVTALAGLFLFLIVLLLGLLIVGFFSDHFFDPEALIYLGLGLLMLWSNIRRRSDATAAVVFDLLALPFQIILIYGAVAMALSSGLGKFLPESWEWPVAPKSEVIVFAGGQKAVFLDDLARIQVYDAEGRYSGGWSIEASYGFNRPRIYKNSGVSGEEEAVVVRQILETKVTVYDLGGRIIGEREWDYERMEFPDHKAGDFPAVFSSGWLKWSLTSKLNGMICILIGLSGSFGLDWIGRRFGTGRNQKTDEEKHE